MKTTFILNMIEKKDKKRGDTDDTEKKRDDTDG